MNIRINKYLASIGVASRRKVDELIDQEKISVNNKILKEKGYKIDPQKDEIKVDGKIVTLTDNKECIYIILNKPQGVVSTTADTHNRHTILDLVKSQTRLFPVGRLDQDSRGLILLTNDGNLTYKLTHPKYHIAKTYLVKILGKVKLSQIEKLRIGIELEDGLTQPAKVKIVAQKQHQTILEIKLFEGKKRQIRAMCSALHLHVQDLQRIAIGTIKLGDLTEGKWRNLNAEEIKSLKNLK
jgi:23S rRNA pseudouridine2605 synthase